MRDLKALLAKRIAHRGFHSKTHPENSLGAFKDAVDNDFNIELDVQLSKDGEVMVFHDDTLKRMTGKEGSIQDYTVKELQAMCLGDSTETIPTFKEVLELVKGKTLIVVEFKNHKATNQALVKKTVKMLQAYKGLYVTKSFSPFIMKMIREEDPSIIRGQLVASFKGEESISALSKLILKKLWLNHLSKPDFISTDFNYYPAFLKRKHKKGLTVICWTVRSREDYLKVKDVFDNVIFEGFNPDK